MGSSTSKSPKSSDTESKAPDEFISDSPTLESDLQNNNVEFDSYQEPSTAFFRGLTNTDFCNVAPPNTIFGDEDVTKNKEPLVIHVIAEEDLTDTEDFTGNTDVEKEEGLTEDTVDSVEEREGNVQDVDVEREDNTEKPEENDIAEEEQERVDVNNEEDDILNQGDNNQSNDEPQEEEQALEDNVEEEDEKGEEDEESRAQKSAAKRKPKTVLEIVYDESVPDVPLQINPPQVEAVAYVQEDDEEDEKFDLTLTEDLSEYFESPIDPLEFDFSLATSNLKPIREFVTKWGFFKAVPTPDVLQRGQRGVRHFNVPAPRTERGYPLPFPIFLTKPPDLKAFETIEETLKLKNAKSFNGFIKFIKHMKNVVDDDELRIRITMKWLSQHSHKIPPLCKNEKTDVAGYAQVHLFYKFCKMLNIECAVIEGRRRIYSREPSLNPGKRAVKAVWCAVMLKGQWRFVDPSLPGIKEMKKMNDEHTEPESENTWLKAMRIKIGEFYCLPDPTLFVYTHLPDVEYWQLLCRPVQESEWYNMVCVSPFFFHHGFDLQSKVTYNIKCNGSHVIITFTYPSDKMFVFTTSTVDQNPPPPKKQKQKNYCLPYVFIESDFEGKTVSVEVFVMHKGTYFLHIYFKDLSCESRDFFYLCTYCLEVTKPNVDMFDSFFMHSRQQWGPADDTLDAGLIPVTHVTSEIECYKDFLDIVFDLQSDLQFHCTFSDREGTDLSRHVIHWVYAKKLNIKVSCPGFQKCALEIYTKNEKDGSLKTVCNYRVCFSSSCKDLKPIMGFPTTMTKLGVNEAGEQLNLRPHFLNPYAMTISEETTLNFGIEYQTSIIFPSLKFVSDKLYNTDSFMLWSFDEDEEKLSVCINPVRSGLYLLTVQNKISVNVVESSTLFFGFINVDIPSNQWSPYPERSMDAQKLVKIEEPKTGYLRSKTEYTFSYHIYNDAQDVAIVTSNGWSHLDESSPHVWEGTVTTGPKGTEVTLNARFEVGLETFTKLLTYKVIPSDEYEGRNKRQEQVRTQRMLAFAQDDDKVKPANKLSEMAERHRKDMKSKAKQENEKREKQFKCSEAAEAITRRLLGKGRKDNEDSETPRTTRNSGWKTVKKEILNKGKSDEKGRPLRGAKAKTTKTLDDDSKSLSSTSNSSVENSKQRRPNKEPMARGPRPGNKEGNERIGIKSRASISSDGREQNSRKSQRGTMEEFTPRAPNKNRGNPEKKDPVAQQSKDIQSSAKEEENASNDEVERKGSAKQTFEVNPEQSQNDQTESQSKDKEGDQINVNPVSDNNDDAANLDTGDKEIVVNDFKHDTINTDDKDSKEIFDDKDETNKSPEATNESVGGTMDGDSQDDSEQQIIEFPEPETLSPATTGRLKAKRKTFNKRGNGKIAFSNPAGTLASPRIIGT